MFAGNTTARAYISCISVHQACSKFPLSVGHYVVRRTIDLANHDIGLCMLISYTDIVSQMLCLLSEVLPIIMAWQPPYLKFFTANNTSTEDYKAEGVWMAGCRQAGIVFDARTPIMPT